MNYRLILLSLILYSSTLFAQRASSTKIVCLTIIDNNQVEIKWTKSNIDSFQSYTLYFSNDGSQFDSISSHTAVDDTTYIHQGINAFNSQKFYYVKVNGSSADISPTAKTLFILGIDVNINGYQADLFWDAFSDDLDPGMGEYHVYYDYPDGNWHLVDSTAQTSLRNITLFTCSDSIHFKVEISYNNICTSNSQVIAGLFTDIVAPDKPVLDSVSVDADGNTVIGWTQSDSMDAVGNIIYRYDGVKWNPIDSVWGYDTQFYVDAVIDPCIENYEYAISTFDSCGNNSPFTDLTAQRPIFLYNINYSICDLQDTLRWIVYMNPKNPVDKYEIWSSKNGASYERIGEKSPSAAVNGEIIFIHQNLDPGANYEYFIRVVMGNITASSCRKQVTTQNYKIPRFVETITADVLADNTVNTTIKGDMDVNNCIWNCWHFDGNQTDTSLVEQITKPDQNSSPFFVADNVDASLNPWFYYTTVIDSCGKLRHTSNTFKTIWLQGYTQNNTNYLNWTAPEGWSKGVEKYYIYRTVTGIEPTSPIDSVDGNLLKYQEAATTLPVEDGRIIYFVQALKKADSTEKITSTSNRFPLFKEATLYFPNAFRPDGTTNTTFKPVFSYFGGTEYLLQIYSRWGKLIYETSDPDKGWNGTSQNEPVEKGAYIYISSYQSVYGTPVTQKGTVVLIR